MAQSRVDATIEHVTDFAEIARHDVFTTPAVVVDGQVVSVGKVPTKEEVQTWLKA